MTTRRYFLVAIGVALAGGSPGGAARAQSGFFKSSPGSLSASHAQLDSQEQCGACHAEGKKADSQKCLACHDHRDLRERIRAGKGYHASSQVRGRNCEDCHLEHRGRGFDVMGWEAVGGAKQFDHRRAGWKLIGKHSTAECADCHRRTDRQGLRLYLGEEASCAGCHRDDQPHGFGRDRRIPCDRCHTEQGWRPPREPLDFDHGKQNPGAMSLRGKHRDLACSACHGERLAKRRPERACKGCHAEHNPHGARFATVAGRRTDCSLCHGDSSWTPVRFRHARYTTFRLRGQHARASCRSCHRGQTRPFSFEKLSDAKLGCTGCHAHAATHGGKFAKRDARQEARACLRCHEQAGVRRVTAAAGQEIHGPSARWPLAGAHENVACNDCHRDGQYQKQSPECGGTCHQDSLHRGELGERCSRCHTSGEWKVSSFDHARQTDWPLDDRHARVGDCAACHPGRRFANTPTDCGASTCHAADDIHESSLGSRCEQCHSAGGKLVFDHNRQTRFVLRGAHRSTPCSGCHATVAFEARSTACSGCHRAPKGHRGRYGSDCESCHGQTRFTNTIALHDVGAFSLGGAHQRLDCDRCHKRSKALRGTGELCGACHRQDDVHQNALSPRCGECHSQVSWTPAHFDHASTGCSPVGTHRSLPCAACHQNGNYGAVSPQCYSCHRDDALDVTEPDHALLLECGQCHNVGYWSNGTGTGPAHGRESICW